MSVTIWLLLLALAFLPVIACIAGYCDKCGKKDSDDKKNLALKKARTALEVWTHQVARELCDPKVLEKYDKIRRDAGGTLAVIADATKAIDAALEKK